MVGSAGSLIPERPWLIAIPKRPGVLSLSLSLSSSVSVSIPLYTHSSLLYPFLSSLSIPLLYPFLSSLPNLLSSTLPLFLLYPSSLASTLALPFLPCLHSCLTLPPLLLFPYHLPLLSHSSHSLSFSLTIHLHVDGQSGRRQVKTNTV